MKEGKNGFHQGLGLGFMGSTVALIVNNLFGDRFSAPVVGGYFWLVWGLVDRSIMMSRGNLGTRKLERKGLTNIQSQNDTSMLVTKIIFVRTVAA